ncbi:MAG: hypothetical protein CVU28_06395 [Betaproteobacteria bacterium HGW-Betaproteobacteria-21]|nr:MAG: hypothetical protein CVU28_06395 [Betaproteobacteria bacterium HGW-Betaproteobacteria-21]
MIAMLASVRTVDEALIAAAAGAGFIDLKEPRSGALGGLRPARIGEIVGALRKAHPGLPISATIGDHTADEVDAIMTRVAEVGDCGVDYVKVGIVGASLRARNALLSRLAAAPWAVVPVFIADRGLDFEAIEAACALPFPALMIDTEDKDAGSLFDCVPAATLAHFVHRVRAAGKLAGLSGALRLHHLPQLLALAPDFAGFRGALCGGTRTGALERDKVCGVAVALRGEAQAVQICAA